MNPPNESGYRAAAVSESSDFDWAGVEDPLDEIREDFAALRVPLTAAQAQAVAEWSRRRHSGDEFALTERAVGWIASGRDLKTRAAGSASRRLRETEGQIAARRLGLRAAIVIYELTPHMRNAMPMDRIATVFSVSKSLVQRTVEDFRAVVLHPSVNPLHARRPRALRSAPPLCEWHELLRRDQAQLDLCLVDTGPRMACGCPASGSVPFV